MFPSFSLHGRLIFIISHGAIKGIVRTKLKFYTFSAHHDVNGGSGDILCSYTMFLAKNIG